MKVKVINFEGKQTESVELSDKIFASKTNEGILCKKKYRSKKNFKGN